MPNTYASPVVFAKENNPITLWARVVFDNNGVPILDGANSKGIIGINPVTHTITAATTNSSVAVGSVSSFAGIYSGMTVTGSTGSIQAGTTISSVNSVGLTLGLSKQAIQTGANNTLVIGGGQYAIQFGQLGGGYPRLTTYYKYLFSSLTWSEVTGSAVGTATQVALAPNASDMFVVSNTTKVITIPATLTSGSTDATLTVQLGNGGGTGPTFQAASPQAGEVAHFIFQFTTSSAP